MQESHSGNEKNGFDMGTHTRTAQVRESASVKATYYKKQEQFPDQKRAVFTNGLYCTIRTVTEDLKGKNTLKEID